MISSVVDTPLSKIKEIDKRLKGCNKSGENTRDGALPQAQARDPKRRKRPARAAKTLKAQPDHGR